MNRHARVTTALMLLFGAVLTGCVSKIGKSTAVAKQEVPVIAIDGAQNRLTDTEWRLEEIQSMDDAIGNSRPNDPNLYTMRLNNDGTVAMHLNCNSATGKWSAEAGPEGSSGRFEFGPLASTRALCPPPSLEETVTMQAPFVRSFLLKDNRLYLSLMADGGIFVWAQNDEEPFLTKPDSSLEKAILQAEPDYTRKVVELGGGIGKGRYVYGRVDLNGDGRDEVFVYLLGSIFCGTGGCNLMLFTDSSNGYSLIDEFAISRLPIIVSTDKSKGWHDLIRLESGGGVSASYVRHSFNGNSYVEQERLPVDRAPPGKKYLSGELTFEKGISLEPQN